MPPPDKKQQAASAPAEVNGRAGSGPSGSRFSSSNEGAVTNVYVEGKRPRQVLLKLHRFLLDPAGDSEVAHLDDDRLNNRRSNLQVDAGRRLQDAYSYVTVHGDIALVELTQNEVAIIDAADAEAVQRHLWHFGEGYAKACVGGVVTGLHRFLMKLLGRSQVDHIDGDPLNNRRSNLRVCTKAENLWNQKPRETWGGKPVTCKYKDVSVVNGAYLAQIKAHGRHVRLGVFARPIPAALAYDRAARMIHGEFARTNFGK